jgi:hypothetical protein
VPIDHTITAHPAGKSLTLADLRAFIDNAAGSAPPSTPRSI